MNFTSSSLRGRIFSFPYWVFCSFCKLLVDCSEMTQGGPLVRMKALNIYGNEVRHIYFCYFSSQWSTLRQHRSLWLVAPAEVFYATVSYLLWRGMKNFVMSSAVSCMSLKNCFIFWTFWTFLNFRLAGDCPAFPVIHRQAGRVVVMGKLRGLDASTLWGVKQGAGNGCEEGKY